MTILDNLKDKQSVQADEQPSEALSLPMNEFSTDAVKRSGLFESIASRQGLTILPGRFGGEYNNDMVAIGDNGDDFILLFGLKTVEEGRDIQLDRMAIGPFLQGSSEWLKLIVYSMELYDELDATLMAKFKEHVENKTISLNLLYLDLDEKQMNILPLAIQ